MSEKYRIVCVADEPYCPHAGVMLMSLLDHNRDAAVEVTLLTTGISRESAEKLERICKSGGGEFRQIVCQLTPFDALPSGQWSRMMYLKLMIPAVMPESADRCLFLDSDMVINGSLRELYTIPLGGNAIAAAEDMPDCVGIKRRLGLSDHDHYINSGVMVCDLNLWRAMEKERGIIDFALSRSGMIGNEQDLLAIYFKGRIRLLPIRWNMTSFYFMREPKIFGKYLSGLNEARRNPAIIHFACPIKPWYDDSRHPYRKLYRRYSSDGPWSGERFGRYEKLSGWGRVKRSVRNILNEMNIMKDPLYYVK